MTNHHLGGILAFDWAENRQLTTIVKLIIELIIELTNKSVRKEKILRWKINLRIARYAKNQNKWN